MKYILLLAAILFANFSQAQSVGAGIVSSMESKANSFDQNEKKINELKNQHFQSYSLEKAKLNALRAELSAIYAERKVVLDELRNGRFCNGCGSTATQLRNRGISNVDQHFRENGGTRPARPEEIKNKEDEYARKIKAQEDVIQNFEFAENEFTRKRVDIDKQIANLEDQNKKLRDEIVQLSKRYAENVLKDGKSVTSLYVSDLMRLVAEKHFIEDRINIINVKITELNSEELKALGESDEKIRIKSEEEKKELNQKLDIIRSKVRQLEQQNDARLAPLKKDVGNLSDEIKMIDQKLLFPSRLKEGELETLQADKASLMQRLADTKKAIESQEKVFESSKQALEDERKETQNKIFEIPINLSKKQQAASEALKKAFQLRRKILDDAKIARSTALQQKGDLILSQKTAIRKRYLDYIAPVDKERVRMIGACRKAEASCYGYDTYNLLVGHWNSAESCVAKMDGAHFSNAPVYGCELESPIYKSHYSSLINGLSDDDIRALQKQSGKVRYDLILQKVSN